LKLWADLTQKLPSDQRIIINFIHKNKTYSLYYESPVEKLTTLHTDNNKIITLSKEYWTGIQNLAGDKAVWQKINNELIQNLPYNPTAVNYLFNSNHLNFLPFHTSIENNQIIFKSIIYITNPIQLLENEIIENKLQFASFQIINPKINSRKKNYQQLKHEFLKDLEVGQMRISFHKYKEIIDDNTVLHYAAPITESYKTNNAYLKPNEFLKSKYWSISANYSSINKEITQNPVLLNFVITKLGMIGIYNLHHQNDLFQVNFFKLYYEFLQQSNSMFDAYQFTIEEFSKEFYQPVYWMGWRINSNCFISN
jgi:hypothetical protein